MPGFSKAQRLLKKDHYDAVLNNGIKVVCKDFVLVASAKTDLLKPTRLGLIVSRKVGQAVARNRIKRCVRDSFRNLSPDKLPGRDLVVIARPSLTDNEKRLVVRHVHTSFLKCLDRLAHGIQRNTKSV